MKTVIIILGVLVLIVGGFFLLKPSQEPTPQEPAANKTMDTSDKDGLTNEEDSMPEFSIEEVEKLARNENTLVAELVDVSGGWANGSGYILRTDDMLYHYVVAQLPISNNKYEGWLAKKEPELMFFSTGVMKALASNDTFSLSYSSENLSEGYNFVVITEETVVDATPETHILEGTAR